ncbi:MAG: AraC family transcriptional regulator [Hyphomicrobiaceae bacterium]
MSVDREQIDRSLWFINGHFSDDITLDDVAEVAHVTRHHLAHVFGRMTGRAVMAYVRGLRLSAAAQDLANGAPDILSVALDAGYGSHEAFSRAFRDLFGLAPEEIRAKRSTAQRNLTKPILVERISSDALGPHRLAESKTIRIAGLSRTLSFDDMRTIPAQWQTFIPHLGHVPGEVSGTSYGVCANMTDSGMDYLTGVEVRGGSDLPKALAAVTTPAARYAVFHHVGHVSRVGDSWGAIWGGALQSAGVTAADTPFFERYGPSFDGRTGDGRFELWVPVET